MSDQSPAAGSTATQCACAAGQHCDAALEAHRHEAWRHGYEFALRNLNDEPVQADLARIRGNLSDTAPGAAPSPVEGAREVCLTGSAPHRSAKAGPLGRLFGRRKPK